MASATPSAGPRHAWRTALLARALLGAVPAGGPLLDVGCGHGSLILHLARAGRPVCGLDPDAARVLRARVRVRAAGLERQVWLLRADATALPLRDRGIAGVALGEVLEHIPRDDLALAESARVLVEGGALALTVPAGSGRMGPIDHLAGHVRRYDRVPLARRVTDAGLTVTTLAGWGFPFGRLYDRWVQRPALLRRPGRARRAIGWLGRRRWVVAAWHAMFAVDARLPAGERGSGWLLVARKPAPAGRTTLVEPKV